MDTIVDDFVRAAQRCERAARALNQDPIWSMRSRLLEAVETIDSAWSQSWVGHHATIYTSALQPARPGEVFDSEWGTTDSLSSRTTGGWAYFDNETIRDEILRRAQPVNLEEITQAAKIAKEAFDLSKDDLLATFDAVLSSTEDHILKELRDKLYKLESHHTSADVIDAIRPNQIMSRDSLAIQQGLKVPAHIAFKAWLVEQFSYGHQASELAKIAQRASRYLEQRLKMKGRTVAKTDGKIFIGHGHSPAWKDLKDFLVDRLKLDYEEFDREPTPGLSTKERLQQMLDAACFAFLVMTAEDEHADGKKHARANVIHEAGLFQGRYGFERAIILLEDGCEEFSNVQGLGQIRFPKDNIKARSEEIRRVLEREGIV